MNTGNYISGIGHGALIAWILLGGLFFNPRPDHPLDVAEVSIITGEQFAALSTPNPTPEAAVTAPAQDAPVVDETPPPAPKPAPKPAPQPAPVPEPQPQPDVVPDTSQIEPLPQEQVVEPAPAPPAPPPVEQSAAPLPKAPTPPKEKAAPRIAPKAAEAPAPDAKVAETVQEEAVPDVAAEKPKPVQEAAAPKEAATEIVTEAEKPAAAAPAPPLAPTTSSRPKSRPAPPKTQVAAAEKPAETPTKPTKPTQPAADPLADAVAAAVSEAVAAPAAAAKPAASSAPAGPPLTGGEKEGLRVAVQACWNVGSLSTEALSTTVVVMVSMTQDAKPEASSIKMTSYDGGSDGAARQAFEAARRAIIRCGASGFDLPVEKYAEWQEIEMTFNPEKMRIK